MLLAVAAATDAPAAAEDDEHDEDGQHDPEQLEPPVDAIRVADFDFRGALGSGGLGDTQTAGGLSDVLVVKVNGAVGVAAASCAELRHSASTVPSASIAPEEVHEGSYHISMHVALMTPYTHTASQAGKAPAMKSSAPLASVPSAAGKSWMYQ